MSLIYKKSKKNEVYQTKKIMQYKIILKSLLFALYDYLIYQVEIHGDDKSLKEIEKAETSDLVRNFYKLKNKNIFSNWPLKIKILYWTRSRPGEVPFR